MMALQGKGKGAEDGGLVARAREGEGHANKPPRQQVKRGNSEIQGQTKKWL